jgi:hypothetical protein
MRLSRVLEANVMRYSDRVVILLSSILGASLAGVSLDLCWQALKDLPTDAPVQVKVTLLALGLLALAMLVILASLSFAIQRVLKALEEHLGEHAN